VRHSLFSLNRNHLLHQHWFLAMPQGQRVTKEVEWIIIWLAGVLSKEEIATYTGYSLATIKHVLLYFEQHGTVRESNGDKAPRKGKLHDVDLEVIQYPFFEL
jgi:hypothetical protein